MDFNGLFFVILFSRKSARQNINLFYFFQINFFPFPFHNSHDKFYRQIIVSNQINQIELWRKRRCCAWVWKSVCHGRGSNSWPRAWCSVWDQSQVWYHSAKAFELDPVHSNGILLISKTPADNSWLQQPLKFLTLATAWELECVMTFLCLGTRCFWSMKDLTW